MGLKSKPLDKVRVDVPVQDVVREDIGRVNINVPLSVRRQWKTAAAQADRSMSEMIIEAMSIYLDTQLSK
ncbi:hypothetical protein [Rhodoferax antarcticus]|uniref:Uncharacterized protein n=1 Tax=Rhodoferax antarcticus ANT.BR TaxID=1111071 RepID=A0A1Q8YBZ2_9BURK|nr:hypothetical protein [Rhodoferax antarcticus]APW46837.1 hypothetical protein RA876_11230 [Rhodoferax antarcticus]OLP05340.1 hypothetical protein BLL52_3465 [Rhodoferax antarcticus ANT.BR]